MIKTYLVGGAVRDKLLNLPVTERDWVVVGATPELLLSQGYQQVGKDFPVFLHPITKEEYALARTERKSGKGYTGFICDFGQSITLEQDLIRRDLTINAIAMDDAGKLIDPYNGVADIHDKVLRHISLAFREDPLRVLRVARFAAKYRHLGFTVADATLQLMQEIVFSGDIANLTPERVWKETEKALATQNPQIYFLLLQNCKALTLLFPHLIISNMVVAALQRSAVLTDALEVRFAVLCAQLSNRQAVEQLCHHIKAPNSYRNTAIIVQQYYQLVHNAKQLDAAQILNLFNSIDVWRKPYHLQQLIIASQAYEAVYDTAVTYAQGAYLQHAYQLVSQIDVNAIIAKGLTGQAIHTELQKLRIKALIDWI